MHDSTSRRHGRHAACRKVFQDVWPNEQFSDFHIFLLRLVKNSPDKLPKGYLRYGMYAVAQLRANREP